MSLKQIVQFSCPYCNNKQPFTIWQSLNASVDPKARADLLEGKLLEFTCELCTKTVIVNSPLLYHDPVRQFMIFLRSANDPISPPAPNQFPFDEFTGNYLLRVVEEERSLVEKIRIFEAELDDRLIEIIKLTSKINLAAHGCKPTDSLVFISSKQSKIDKGTINLVWSSEAGIRDYRPPFELYNLVTEEFAGEISSAQSREWTRIDERYAMRLLAKQ